jgi:hypothetical protein
MHWHTNWCSATVSIGEQFPEDGIARPKHIANNFVILITF